MDEIKYVIGLFLNRTDDILNIKKIVDLANFVANSYGTIYSEFGFCFDNDGKQKNKTLVYSLKNLNKLQSLDFRNDTLIYFEKFKGKKDYQDTQISFTISITDDNNFPVKIKITIDPVLITTKFCVEDIIKIIEKINLLSFKLEYGVVFVMETRKMPDFFLSGTVTPGLDQEEREIANALSINMRQYRNMIWDIFWYNIIKKELIKTSMLDEIKEIINETNVIETAKKYIICLPLQHNEYIEDKAKLDVYKNKLRQLFEKENLIMYKYSP